jgi:uncharacterized protein (DUF2141 family)
MIARIASALLGASLTCLVSWPSAAADLKITVDNLRSDAGQLLICVFSMEASDAKAYPDCEKGRPIRSQKASISNGKVALTYTGLKDGVYAIAAIHDENGNGKLDTNFVGIPTEGIGISNNPRLMGAPGFEEAKFNITGNTAVAITMKYFL